MPPSRNIRRRALLSASVALGTLALPAFAQTRTMLRISTPAVSEDWHARMRAGCEFNTRKRSSTRILAPCSSSATGKG